ncbi:hypothetical protein PZC96_002820 [Salmonella enterica]|nr:hypothetical protein [Salmonella enterica]
MVKQKNRLILRILSGCILVLLSLPVLAMSPGCQEGSVYTGDKGVQNVNLPLAPAEINLNKDSVPGEVVYETDLIPFQFTCYSDSTSFGPVLATGNNFITTMNPILKQAGLRLRIEINGKTWYPWGQGVSGSTGEFMDFSTNYTAKGSRTEQFPGGKLQLILAEPVSKPVRVIIPKTDAVVLVIYGPGRKGSNYISIGSLNASRVSFIPQCIGRTEVPAVIDLGRVITGGPGSLPSPRSFYIKPSFNKECEGFSDISSWGGFALNLNIQFEVSNAGDLTPGNTGIRLKRKGSDGSFQDNGLILVIKKNGATPVEFNKWDYTGEAITINNNPLNLFYTASLAPLIPGNTSSALSGKFSQQVTVKVRYE